MVELQDVASDIHAASDEDMMVGSADAKQKMEVAQKTFEELTAAEEAAKNRSKRTKRILQIGGLVLALVGGGLHFAMAD
jgi:hypothetical protein